MWVIFLYFITLLIYSGQAMEHPNVSNRYSHEESGEFARDIHEVAPGVYAGQAKVGNEIVYFGMEQVDAKNVVWWDKYKNKTRYLTEHSKGILQLWSSGIATGEERPLFSEAIQERTGFTEQEYEEFWGKLEKAVKNSKIVTTGLGTDPSVVHALSGIPSAIVGFQISEDGSSYVVYASKKPVKGRYPFPEKVPEFISLKQYYEYFGDIIMTVRSRFKLGDTSYANRGIFKNPISFIEDGDKYPGLSMKLHGFSAAVVHHLSKNTEYMTVSPVASMRAIIIKTKGWKRGDLIINGKDVLDFTKEELERFEGSQQMSEEPSFHIKIEALIRLFQGK